ncbi:MULTISPECIES: hypothetical protein [Prochlorococcus]|uniref:hypothetical protein n=1 Tax=Prochlorococcus TaxID=1218 RepID=UPI000533A333|nr:MULTISPECIES: hypothetical protein [Prochlorococcus]KGG12703.1 hypothetical protein EV05_1921 [Prochlorococcus sp. MIT 0601]
MLNEHKRLQGEELASYIKKNGHKFHGDGDQLCVAVGYGIAADDGSIKCNLSHFTNELDKVSDSHSEEDY